MPRDLGALIKEGLDLGESETATPAQCRDYLERLGKAEREMGPMIFEAVYAAAKAEWEAARAVDPNEGW